LSEEPGFTKQTGVAHVFAAYGYSMAGAKRLWGEQAFRHEVQAFVAGLVILLIAGVGVTRLLGFLVLMMLLFAVEALNTAVEEVIDRISPEISTVGKHAKDLGSFAVFCILVANGAYFLWALIV
jgi:diacylglycerol kinase (ATP)